MTMLDREISWRVLAAIMVIGCSDRPVEDPDCEQPCEVLDQWPGVGECRNGSCTPTFSECFEKSEHGTCSEMCEAAGSVCAENSCADGTYLIYAVPELCVDPMSQGVLRPHGCDEPIDWQFNIAARCCCEQP
jgi:hypothetical protein